MSSYKKQKSKSEEYLNAEEQNQKEQILAFQSFLENLTTSNPEIPIRVSEKNVSQIYPFAFKVCSDALSNELKRIHRNEKLRKKFVEEQRKLSTASSSSDDDASSVVLMDRVKEEDGLCELQTSDQKCTPNFDIDEIDMSQQDRNEDEEWETIEQLKEEQSSPLGRKLAEEVILCLASTDSNAYVSAPLAAVALSLHCAMVSSTLSFKCTGCIPTKDLVPKTANGFAQPIRDLPRNTFLPKYWDNEATLSTTISVGNTNVSEVVFGYIALRYRKDGVGNVTLRLTQVLSDDNHLQMVENTRKHVKVDFLRNDEPLKSEPFVFPLEDYLNLPAFEKAVATASNRKVLPSLHFKSLPILLGSFTSYFDLGRVNDSIDDSKLATKIDETKRFVDAYVSMLPESTQVTSKGENNRYNANHLASRPGRPPTVDDFGIPQRNSGLFQGDFASDLVPGGIVPPGQHIGGTGNLMGPNHPMFIGENHQGPGGNGSRPDFGGNIPRFGGLGMQPRFDPYGPPGGPTDPNNGPLNLPGRGQGQGRGKKIPPPPPGGDPNPDHMKPPNDLSNNMFM